MKKTLLISAFAFAGFGGIAHAQTAEVETDEPIVAETETTVVTETTEVEPVTNADYADMEADVDVEADADEDEAEVDVDLEDEDEMDPDGE